MSLSADHHPGFTAHQFAALQALQSRYRNATEQDPPAEVHFAPPADQAAPLPAPEPEQPTEMRELPIHLPDGHTVLAIQVPAVLDLIDTAAYLRRVVVDACTQCARCGWWRIHHHPEHPYLVVTCRDFVEG